MASGLMAVCVEHPANNLKKILFDRKSEKVLRAKFDENDNTVESERHLVKK